MVWAYVAITVGWIGIWNYFVWREIRFTLWQTLRDIVPFFVISAVTMLVTYYITQGISNVYLLLASRIVLAVAIYLLAMWLCGAKILKESIAYLLKKEKC